MEFNILRYEGSYFQNGQSTSGWCYVELHENDLEIRILKVGSNLKYYIYSVGEDGNDIEVTAVLSNKLKGAIAGAKHEFDLENR